MAKELPANPDGMIGYGTSAVPTTDAADTTGASHSEITGNPLSMESPLQVVSLATDKMDAPATGAFQETNLHQDGWLNPMNPALGNPSR